MYFWKIIKLIKRYPSPEVVQRLENHILCHANLELFEKGETDLSARCRKLRSHPKEAGP